MSVMQIEDTKVYQNVKQTQNEYVLVQIQPYIVAMAPIDVSLMLLELVILNENVLIEVHVTLHRLVITNVLILCKNFIAVMIQMYDLDVLKILLDFVHQTEFVLHDDLVV